tara:strand:+ start:1314 stop:2801 length:1488 start_codon:yes stop_codon:yes gene_type:complete
VKELKIDLKEEFVVLGSGLSALSAAKTFLSEGFPLTVIDSALNESNSISKKEFKDYQNKFSSPKFKDKNNSWVYANYKKQTKLKEKKFSSIGSLSKGGLSNIWGASINEYSEKELENFFYEKEKKDKAYNFVSNILTKKNFSNDNSFNYFKNQYPEINLDKNCLSILNSKDSNSANISFKPPRNSIFKVDSNHRKDDWIGKVNNYSIFNAKTEFEKIKNHKKIKMFENFFIISITKVDGHYQIKTKNICSGKHTIFIAKYVFICLGVISTTKLILKMKREFNKKIKFLTTPAAILSLISISYTKENNLNLSNLYFEKLAKKNIISGNIFPIEKSLINKAFKNYPIKNLIMKFLVSLLPRIYMVNIYFSSNYSDNKISLNDKNEILIEGKNKPELKKEYKKFRKDFLNSIKNKKIYPLPLFSKLLRPGEDIHYGGTFPMKLSPKNLECSIEGKLENYENLYICDSSSMPFLSGKPHSFNLMVQSHLIVSNFLNSKF